MKKIFSAKIFVIALFTYLFTFIVFVIAAMGDPGGSFLDMPLVVGLIVAIRYGFPVIVIITIVYILVKVRPKTLLIGYLILTVGVFGVVYGAIQLRNLSNMNDFYKRQAEKSSYFESTIFPEIEKMYPEAELGLSEGILPAAILTGYTYDTLPDFEEEREKWDALKHNPVLMNQKYNFCIEYYCKNMDKSFANFRLSDNKDDYDWYFKTYGMSEECDNKVISKLKEYIGDKYPSYTINNEDDKIVVSTNMRITNEEEPAEAEYWQNFFTEKAVNIQLFDIKILYHKAGEYNKTKIYDPFFVDKERWSESDSDHISYY